MLIQLDNLVLVDDLCAHFTRSDFKAVPVSSDVVEIGRPDAPNADQEAREVSLHLRVWQALNPGEAAALVN